MFTSGILTSPSKKLLALQKFGKHNSHCNQEEEIPLKTMEMGTPQEGLKKIQDEFKRTLQHNSRQMRLDTHDLAAFCSITLRDRIKIMK